MTKPLDANAINVRNYSSEAEPSTPLATQAGTLANRTSADLTNYVGRGLLMHVKIANLAGVPSFRLKINWKDNSGNYNLVYQGPVMSANGDYWMVIYPGHANTGGFNDAQQICLPRNYNVVLAYTGNGTTDKADTTVDTDILI